MLNTDNSDSVNQAGVSRRQFLKNSTLLTATAVAAVNFPSVVSAQTKPDLNAVVIGMGGRGSGAGDQFLRACKEVGVQGKVVATADVWPENALNGAKAFGTDQKNCFSGFDAYIKALEVPGVNYAILASPPGFRPIHFKAAVERNKNAFIEKPVATDAPGCRVMYAAYEDAKKKGLKVAAGTQRRHKPSYIQTIQRIHDGEIGDVVSLRGYWVNGGPIWFYDGPHYGQKMGDTALEKQLNNWYHYIWLSGDHICEQHVHNIDVCNWVMKDHPVRCWGMGARQQLGNKSGEIWDNFAIEYEYANGVRMHAYCGQIRRSWASVSEAVHGSKGTAEMHDGRNFIKPKGGASWRPTGIKNDDGWYVEHVDLIKAITEGTELNEAKNVTDSTLTAIMGREAAYSGSQVEWDAMLNCKFGYGPAEIYTDASKLVWGDFRTLRPPMPSTHDILKDPALFQKA